MNDYCTKLKRLADQLTDISHPISKPSQVLNLLRGLNPKYRYIKPVITAKYPPHTFMSVRSILMLEEVSIQHDAAAEATQALTATHGEQSGNKEGSSSSAPRRDNYSNNGNDNSCSNNRGDHRRGHNYGNDNGGGPRSNNSNAPNNPW